MRSIARLIALALIPGSAYAQQFDFSIKNMMRGPELYGREPQNVRWSADGNAVISLEPRSGIAPAGSVAVTAAQIALSLNPSRIGFAGIDLTATKAPRFYETEGDTAMSKLDVAVDRILGAFSLIKLACDEEGIAVENYSPTSLLSRVDIHYIPRLSPQN